METKFSKFSRGSFSGFMTKAVILVLFITASGLSYLYLKHQAFQAGERRKSLEGQLQTLSVHGRDLDWQIASLTSRSSLQQRMHDRFINMSEIADADVVHLRIFSSSVVSQTAALNSSNSQSQRTQ